VSKPAEAATVAMNSVRNDASKVESSRSVRSSVANRTSKATRRSFAVRGEGGGLGPFGLGGGGDSVTYATPVLRPLACTVPPVWIKKSGMNMAAGLLLSTLEKAAGVTVAVGGKYTVEDTTTLPALMLLMNTLSVVTPAEEAMPCLKLLSNVLRAAGSARDDMSMVANVMVELTVLTACWPAVGSGGGTMVGDVVVGETVVAVGAAEARGGGDG
jgi:hypothetical protein